MGTYTVLSGEKDFVGDSSQDTYIIGSNATKVSIGGNVNTDIINIEGVAPFYQIKAKGGSITLTDGDTTIKFKLAKGDTVNLHFLDGDLQVSFNGKRAFVEDQRLTSKLRDFSEKTLEAKGTNTSVGVFEDLNPATPFMLTTGVDNFIGTAGNDTFLAAPVNTITGSPATTLQSFDSIDGGAGTDTLNIYTQYGADFTYGEDFGFGPSGGYVEATTHFNNIDQVGTVKNVEIINIYNSEPTGLPLGPLPVFFSGGGSVPFGLSEIDASKFEGAKQIWQINAATDIAELAEGTTAGFRNLILNWDAHVDVSAADTAKSVSIALDKVKGSAGGPENAVILDVAGKSVDTINVAGTILQRVEDKCSPAYLRLDAAVSGTASTITINTAVDTALTLAGAAAMTTLDASKSTGGVEFDASPDKELKVVGGSGNDSITISDLHDASVSLGAGDDAIVFESGADAVGDTGSVTAGPGSDTIVFQNIVDAVSASATTALSKKVTGFDALEIGTTNGGGEVKVNNLNAGGANSINTIILDGGSDGGTFSGLTNNSTVDFEGDQTGTYEFKITNADKAGSTSDTINFRFDVCDNVSVNEVKASYIENINITTDNSKLNAGDYAEYFIDTLVAASAKNITVDAAADTEFWLENYTTRSGDDVTFSLKGAGDIWFGNDTSSGGFYTPTAGIDSGATGHDLTINYSGSGSLGISEIDTTTMTLNGTVTYNLTGKGDFTLYQHVDTDLSSAEEAPKSVVVNAASSTGTVTFGQIDGNYAYTTGIVTNELSFTGSTTKSNIVVADVKDAATIAGGAADDIFMLCGGTSSSGGVATYSITTGSGDDQILIDYYGTAGSALAGAAIVTINDATAGDVTNINAATLQTFTQQNAIALLIDAELAAAGTSFSNIAFVDLAGSGRDDVAFTYAGNTYLVVGTGIASGTLDNGEILIKLVGTPGADVISAAFGITA